MKDENTLRRFTESVRERFDENGYTEYTFRNSRTRTLRQNSALHGWLRAISSELNNKGLDMRVVLKDDIEIPWDQNRVKEHLFRPVMKAMLNIDSTKDLKTHEVNQVVDVLNKKFGQRFGIYIPFGDENE